MTADNVIRREMPVSSELKMQINKSILLVLLLLTFSFPARAQRAAPSTSSLAPDALVAALYRTHDKKNSPFFQTRSRALLTKYFTNDLANLIWKDAVSSKGEVGALDADPLYHAQDSEIKKFLIHKPKLAGDKAEVLVSFENFGQKEEITFTLVSSQSNWKISNLKYKDGTDLVGIFRDSAAEYKNHAFEGSYRVGGTTCTVKPIKMAFAVRWGRQPGTEIFFFDNDTPSSAPVFVSQNKGKGVNKFLFDNDRYESGKFVYADGRALTVARIK
jgi:hypothetical protein